MELVMGAGKIYAGFSTAWTTVEFGVRFPTEAENILVYGASYPMDTGCFFPSGKVAWSEADHLHPSDAEIKTDGAVSPLHLHLYGAVLN
jgi:hypothetical protein